MKHLSLLKRVDHDWCRAMVDIGQYRSPDPYTDLAIMRPDYDPFVEVPRLLADLRRAIQETAPTAP